MRRFFTAIVLLSAALTSIAQTGNTHLYGPTTQNEQLWQIAILVRPTAQISIQQTMLALLKTNPAAFSDDNVNSLKSNVVLKIPNFEQIKQTSLQDASLVVAQQDKIWQQQNSPNQNNNTKTNQNNDRQQLTSLQQQFDNLGRILQSFDQQYQVRIADLEQHNLTLQLQLQKLHQQIQNSSNTLVSQAPQSAVTTEMKPGEEPSAHSQTPVHKRIMRKVDKLLAPVVEYLQKFIGENGVKGLLIAVIVLLFLLILVLITGKNRKKLEQNNTAKKNQNEKDTDSATESEYNFMGSTEGIPAKLNLSRAYIDMGDEAAARNVLQEIIKVGNHVQQQEALGLLRKIGRK